MLSNVELAERVALTPTPCLRRIKCLEDKSLIYGYCARLDPEAVGRAIRAYMAAEISMASREIVEQCEAALIPNEEVIEVRRVHGAIGCLVRIDVEDSNAYELPNQRSTRCQVYHGA